MPGIVPGTDLKRLDVETLHFARDVDLTSEPYDASVADDADFLGAGTFEGDNALHDGDVSILSGDFGFQTVDNAFQRNDASEPEPGALASAVDIPVVSGAAWNSMLAHAFASNMQSNAALLLPWETGTMRAVFCDDVLPSMDYGPADMSDTTMLAFTSAEPSTTGALTAAPTSAQPAYMSAVKCLRDLDYIDEKRVQMSLAASRWMEILSINWNASQVGEQISMDLQADPTGALAEQSLHAVFGTKSATTILKRAASLKQYISWFHKTCLESEVYLCPLPLMEDDVWRYFIHLRNLTKTNKRGYTVSSTFLETVRFSKFVLGLHHSDDILSSKRLLGFAAVERREKGPLNQAPPLEVEHLQRLHEILLNGANDIDRIGAGAFLCAIYARARWSDLRYIHHIKYDGYKRNATCDLYTAEHKTSTAGLRREQFLPLVIPTEGIVHGDWLGVFIKLCQDHGTQWEKVPFGPLLPAPTVDGGWCIRPLSTSEAAAWLRRLLDGCKGASEIRAHSMKVTLCVWAARAGFSKEHRATLSHHATALNGSDVVYSRELQTGAIRKLQMLLKKIRVGLDPRTEQAPLDAITAAFDSGHKSVVRTPMFESRAPCTPLPVVETNVQQAEKHVECKVETSLHDLCVLAASETAPFGDFIQDKGLIAIDSSSGSDSSSSSSDEDDDSSDDHFSNALPGPVYSETVPEGSSYFVHKKSKIMHRARSAASVTFCKTHLNDNFKETERKIFFKYPKCMRCFVHDHNRLKTVDAVVKALDSSAKRRKAPDS